MFHATYRFHFVDTVYASKMDADVYGIRRGKCLICPCPRFYWAPTSTSVPSQVMCQYCDHSPMKHIENPNGLPDFGDLRKTASSTAYSSSSDFVYPPKIRRIEENSHAPSSTTVLGMPGFTSEPPTLNGEGEKVARTQDAKPVKESGKSKDEADRIGDHLQQEHSADSLIMEQPKEYAHVKNTRDNDDRKQEGDGEHIQHANMECTQDIKAVKDIGSKYVVDARVDAVQECEQDVTVVEDADESENDVDAVLECKQDVNQVEDGDECEDPILEYHMKSAEDVLTSEDGKESEDVPAIVKSRQYKKEVGDDSESEDSECGNDFIPEEEYGEQLTNTEMTTSNSGDTEDYSPPDDGLIQSIELEGGNDSSDDEHVYETEKDPQILKMQHTIDSIIPQDHKEAGVVYKVTRNGKKYNVACNMCNQTIVLHHHSSFGHVERHSQSTLHLSKIPGYAEKISEKQFAILEQNYPGVFLLKNNFAACVDCSKFRLTLGPNQKNPFQNAISHVIGKEHRLKSKKGASSSHKISSFFGPSDHTKSRTQPSKSL